MERLLDRLKKDITKLQKTIKKEGDTLVQKIQEIDLKNNFQKKKKQLEKRALKNIKKVEPICQKIVSDITKKAKKAGIDLNKIEKKIKKVTKTAKKKLTKTNTQVKKAVKDIKKKTSKKVIKKKKKIVTKKKNTAPRKSI